MSTFEEKAADQIPAESERINDADKAWDTALAEKPARDFGRESGTTPEEKKMFDQIAERHGEAKLKELEGIDKKADELQNKHEQEKELRTGLQESLARIREELGIRKPEGKEDPSLVRSEERLRRFASEHGNLANMKEKYLQQFEDQIKDEIKNQFIQKRSERIFDLIESVPKEDMESLEKTGKTRDGKLLEEKGYGEVEPETAIVIIEAFNFTAKDASKILDKMPDFFDRLGNKFKQEVDRDVSEVFDKLVEKIAPEEESVQKSEPSSDIKSKEAPQAVEEGQDVSRVGMEDALTAAYAEKPLRDFARESDINPEEKAKIDSIAERRGNEALTSLEAANPENNQTETNNEDYPDSLENLKKSNDLKREELKKEGFDV